MDEIGWDGVAGLTLRGLREQRQWTQDDLAERAGVSNRATISALEAGEKKPSLLLVRRLARALGVSVSALLGETPLAQDSGGISHQITGDHTVIQNLAGHYYGVEVDALLARMKPLLREAMQELLLLLQAARTAHDGQARQEE